MTHVKYVYFEGTVLVVGNSLMITIPKPNADYLGIMGGDTVEAKITRIRNRKPLVPGGKRGCKYV